VGLSILECKVYSVAPLVHRSPTRSLVCPRNGSILASCGILNIAWAKMLYAPLVSLLLLSCNVFGFNFQYESIQLQSSEVRINSDISFGNGNSTEQPQCKTFPGYEGWPLAGRWSALNTSLGGALLRALPPAAACYEGEFRDESRCDVVRRGQGNVLFAWVLTAVLSIPAKYTRQKRRPSDSLRPVAAR
jgi:hypothetical protein